MGFISKKPLENSYGIQQMQQSVPEGSRLDVYSPNFCDKTTWYEESERVTAETLTDSGDGLTFNSAHTYWIDTTHGKIFGEANLNPVYEVIITVNDVEVDENSPGDTDGDYTVNYNTGDVTFNSSQSGNTVKATYSYENGSRWTIQPASGKIVRLVSVELQYSDDVVLNDTVQFTIWVAGYPYRVIEYKTMMDFIIGAEGSYPIIKAVGGSGWRGAPRDINILRWPYDSRGATDLKYSWGMKCTVEGINDIVCDGSFLIISFFAVSENE